MNNYIQAMTKLQSPIPAWRWVHPSFRRIWQVTILVCLLPLVGSLIFTPTLAAAQPSFSCVNYTTANGLGNNKVRDVYAVGNTIYVATAGGLSISTDGGATWTNKTVADGLGENNVAGVYAVGSTIYAATDRLFALPPFGPGAVGPGGLSISTDGGATWTNKTHTNLNFPVPTSDVLSVYADGSTVYVTTRQNGIGISTDGGATWTSRTPASGLSSSEGYGVYAIGSTVYAATYSGVNISTNGGNNWIWKDNTHGLGQGSSVIVRDVYAVGSTVYAAVGANTPAGNIVPGALSISTDGGTTWTNKTQANGLGADDMRGVYASGSMVYVATTNVITGTGGLSISTDGGATWANYTTANGLVNNGVNRVYAIGSKIYAATDGGLSLCTFTLPSSNADLSDLTLSNGTLTPAFTPGNTNYTVTVSSDIVSLNVTATFSDTTATATTNGAAVTSGSPSAAIRLNVGANVLPIVVTAQDGTIKTYTVTVTRAACPNPLVVSSNTNNGYTLPWAVDCANDGDLITFDTAVFSVPTTITLASQIEISKSLTISGTGAENVIISGNNITRVFDIKAGLDVTIRGITLRDGNAGPPIWGRGGAIRSRSSLTLTHSTLYNNKGSDGGALSIEGPPVAGRVLSLHLDSVQAISNTTISPSNGYGGGVFINGIDSVDISATDFTSNTSNQYGGALYVEFNSVGGEVHIDNSNFVLNRAPYYGGALYLEPKANSAIWITATHFLTNSVVDDDGGAIMFDGFNAKKTFIVDSYFAGNFAGRSRGGALRNSGTETIIVGSSFIDNYVGRSEGGAIHSDSTGILTVAKSSFIDNKALLGSGGAIYNKSVLRAENATFWSNEAGKGGSIYNAADAMLTNVTISANRALTEGGGIFVDSGRTVVLTNTLVVNSVGGDVGGSGAVTGTNNLTGTVALGPLQDNGGPTWTMLPSAEAIDAGTPVGCPATDQRGVTRPQGIACDIGAVEFVDTRLSSLAINPGVLQPTFISTTLAYTALVGYADTPVTVIPVRANVATTVTVQVAANGGVPVACPAPGYACPLAVGSNLITTTVTAADGTVKTYTVTVTRTGAAGTGLSGLQVERFTESGAAGAVALNPAFASVNAVYTAVEPFTTASVLLTPAASAGDSTVAVTVTPPGGSALVCQGQPPFCPLEVGENVVTVTVTEANGVVTAYTITITRQPSTVVFTANDAAGVLEGESVQIFPLANDQDPAGAGLRIMAATASSNGVVQVSQDAQSLTYTPAAQFSGLDFFNYTAEDGSGATSTSMVAVVVTALAREDTPQVAVIHPTQPTTASFRADSTTATLIMPPGAYNGTAGPLGPRDVFYIVFTEIVTPAANVEVSPAPALSFAGKVFTLDAFFNNLVLDNYVFPSPVEFTIAYDPTRLNGLAAETLQLFYWDVDTQQWSQDGLTFVSNDTVNHMITYRVAHFTEFSYFGSGTPSALEPEMEPQIDNWIYLPAVQR